jgi:hypothetical protein
VRNFLETFISKPPNGGGYSPPLWLLTQRVGIWSRERG